MAIEWKKNDLPTLAQKVADDASETCQNFIYAGIDVELSDGTQHFSLMPNDQTNIDSMFAAITLGASEYPYHPDGGKCVMYSAADIITLYSEYKSFVTKQTTYCNGAAPVGEARDRPECYRRHLLRMRPSRGPRKGSRGHSQRGAGADYGHHQQALRLRRTEMARNSVCKTAILFVFGGLVYFGLEVLFRGHSHWTMFVLGGFLFLILGELNEGLLEWDTPLIWQGVLGSAIVTGAELVTGMILNVWLGLGVWDYSGMPFNYKGQICLPFSILWIFVSIAAVVLDDWLRYWLFGEEHPHYTLFRRGESR